jgi:hypothetical protein
MPSWLTDLLNGLGLTTPAIWAAFVYGLCHWADKKSSDDFKLRISKLLQPRRQDPRAISETVVEIFNRVYAPRLLSWTAFSRSAFFTIAATLIIVLETYQGDKSFFNKIFLDILFISLARSLTVNVVLDYLSLFVVRHLLTTTTGRPLLALWIGPLSGMLIVLLSKFSIIAVLVLENAIPSGGTLSFWPLLHSTLRDNIINPEWLGLLISPLVVHLWLPLFSISVGVLRLLNYFRQAVGWTQWFLKEGNRHPLEAIGYVAAIIVFIGTVIAIKL